MLQPWEEMRQGNAKATRSLEVNYHSLPPQFVFWRALKARHVQLALTCFMTIPANGLAAALGGLMYEDTVIMSNPASFSSKYIPTLKTLNGAGDPFFAPNVEYGYRLGIIFDGFYRIMSNSTASTPLPVRTDTTNA